MTVGGWSLVDLAVPSGEAESRADRIRHWLIYEQIVIPNPTRDDLWQPSELAPGPAWRVVVGREDDGEFLRVADNGVDVRAGWTMRGTTGSVSPVCPRCGTSLVTDEYHRLVEEWDRLRTEPAPICLECGSSGPLGTWVGEDVALGGSMAVTFHHWPRPCPAFLISAGQRLGSRVGFATSG
jgi:hypothetical protein